MDGMCVCVCVYMRLFMCVYVRLFISMCVCNRAHTNTHIPPHYNIPQVVSQPPTVPSVDVQALKSTTLQPKDKPKDKQAVCCLVLCVG